MKPSTRDSGKGPRRKARATRSRAVAPMCSTGRCRSESTGVMHVELWDETTNTTTTHPYPMCHRCSGRWWGAGEWRGYLDGSSKLWGSRAGSGRFRSPLDSEPDPDDA